MEPQPTDPIWMQILSLIAEVLKIFLAAFLGAACAFAYERRKRLDDELERRPFSLREAQFAFASRINSLLNTSKKYLKEHENNPNRWVELPLVLNIMDVPPLPIAELSFLLDNIAPNLLGKIIIEGNKFEGIRSTIITRNKVHDEFQRVYEQGAISKRLQIQLKDLTDGLYTLLPEALTSMQGIHEKIGQIMSKHFPKVNVLRLDPKVEEMIKNLQPTASEKNNGQVSDLKGHNNET
ncbi:hypothetical protein ACFLQR_03215, partial [Verrucomicrobiota bacterium]